MQDDWGASYPYEGNAMDSLRVGGPKAPSGYGSSRVRRRVRMLILTCFILPKVGSFEPALATDAAEIASSGNGAGAPACSACHGQSGEGRPDAGYPRLAGLNADYLLQQLNDFASGARASDIMHPVAKALSEDERKAMAAFYASAAAKKAPAGQKPDQKLRTAGAALAERGLWAKGIPACGQCHGPDGQGVGNTFPRLAGQSSAYIIAQLTSWKDGKRTNDPLHLMTGIASKLDDQQIAAVADYYAALEPQEPTAETKGAKP